MSLCIAYSSWGIVEFDSLTGKVIQAYEDKPRIRFWQDRFEDMFGVKDFDLARDEEFIHNIERFDVNEYAEWYGFAVPKAVDIVDIGFWMKSGDYIEADKGHREEKLPKG